MFPRALGLFVHISCIASLILAIAMPAFAQESEKKAEATDQELFYLIGVALAGMIDLYSPTDQEKKQVEKGLGDALAGNATGNPDEYREQFVALKTERDAATAAIETKESVKFLAEAGQREGVVVTESGLIMREISAGSGESPEASNLVKVHYTGRLRNGEVFDSSVERGEPAVFPLDRVIPCWTEGVAKMKVGGTSELICPAAIAYGEQGSGRIPGGAALVFEVELIEIMPDAAASGPPGAQ